MTGLLRSAGETVDDLLCARTLVEPALREAVSRLPDSIAEVAVYHFGWENGEQGKSIRPALVFLAAEAAGGTAEEALSAAVAVELVHNFSLLHDDVMDDDRMRRHRPAAWVVFGVSSAILTGDALLALAMRVLADGGGPEPVTWLTEALMTLVDGQSSDLARATGTGLADCVEMAAAKTGALLGVACALGASAGGAAPERIPGWRRFGEELGLAFQLADDLLGIWGDPRRTGKPVGADLAARKRSLPVVAALTAAGPAAAELAARYADPEPLSGEELDSVARLIERAGGRDWARAESGRRLESALAWLEKADPEPQAARRLTELARLLTYRDR